MTMSRSNRKEKTLKKTFADGKRFLTEVFGGFAKAVQIDSKDIFHFHLALTHFLLLLNIAPTKYVLIVI
jgi:hypothetical protein